MTHPCERTGPESPQGICDICGHPFVGLAMDCACTGSPTKKLINTPKGSVLRWIRSRFQRRVF